MSRWRVRERVAGLIGIAAAPDFTEDLLWAEFTDEQRARIETDGVIALPNPYADEPVKYPWHLITDGRDNLRLRGGLDITCPVHLLHGMKDEEVPWQTATSTAQCLAGKRCRAVRWSRVPATGFPSRTSWPCCATRWTGWRRWSG